MDDRLKRLLYRSSYTGTKELDLVLGGFARAHLAGLDAGQLDRYEALLTDDDPRLYLWIVGRDAPRPEFDTDVLRLIQAYAARAGAR
jgi:antitoxin CptB